jgi:hypothetical protein
MDDAGQAMLGNGAHVAALKIPSSSRMGWLTPASRRATAFSHSSRAKPSASPRSASTARHWPWP